MASRKRGARTSAAQGTPRSMFVAAGVTADGRGVGPRAIPRDQVQAVRDQLVRHGYFPVFGIVPSDGSCGPCQDGQPGDFHTVPGPESGIPLVGDPAVEPVAS